MPIVLVQLESMAIVNIPLQLLYMSMKLEMRVRLGIVSNMMFMITIFGHRYFK